MGESNPSRTHLKKIVHGTVRIGNVKRWAYQKVPDHFVVAAEEIEDGLVLWRLLVDVTVQKGRRIFVIPRMGMFLLDPATAEELAGLEEDDDDRLFCDSAA